MRFLTSGKTLLPEMCTVVTKQPQKRDSELQPTAITDCRLTNEQAPGEAGQVLRA